MRRCTVYHGSSWEQHPTQIFYEGWLLQVEPTASYPKCVVVDDKGRMRVHQLEHVKLHVPSSIPLLHGAPRRGGIAEISATGGPGPNPLRSEL